MTETGITSSVITSTSTLREYDLANEIAAKKADTVLSWIEKEHLSLSNVLIFGLYFTGAALASRLDKKAKVTVIDIYPHLAELINGRIDFFTHISEVPCRRWSLIIDTTGLGGVDKQTLSSLYCDALIVEDPCSDASDICICSASNRREILMNHSAPKKGLLTTTGLNTKTSGTMTLTVAAARRAAAEAEKLCGTLYAVSAADFPERILFKERDMLQFQAVMSQPALRISSLKEIDVDAVLRESLSRIRTEIIEVETNDRC